MNLQNYISDRAIADYRDQASSWLSRQYQNTCTRLSSIPAVVKRHMPVSLTTSKDSLLRHKWTVGTLIIAVALTLIYYYTIRKHHPQIPPSAPKAEPQQTPPPPPKEPPKPTPQPPAAPPPPPKVELPKPEANIVSSLHIGKLTIKTPPKMEMPLNVTLTLCLDTSGSMSDHQDRGPALKIALNKIVLEAQEVVNKQPNAQISLTIVGFSNSAKLILPTTTFSKSTPMIPQKIIDQLKTLSFSGGTEISTGLEEGINQLKTVAKSNLAGAHTFALLTDGDGSILYSTLATVSQVTSEVQAQFFAIGVGQSHKKETLEEAAKKAQGTYIDTTLKNTTIQTAIARVFKQTLSYCQGFQLQAPLLPKGSWSVQNITQSNEIPDMNLSICSLGQLPENKTSYWRIELLLKQFNAPFDLSNLVFLLTYSDHQRQKQEIQLPWNANLVINPSVI